MRPNLILGHIGLDELRAPPAMINYYDFKNYKISSLCYNRISRTFLSEPTVFDILAQRENFVIRGSLFFVSRRGQADAQNRIGSKQI